MQIPAQSLDLSPILQNIGNRVVIVCLYQQLYILKHYKSDRTDKNALRSCIPAMKMSLPWIHVTYGSIHYNKGNCSSGLKAVIRTYLYLIICYTPIIQVILLPVNIPRTCERMQNIHFVDFAEVSSLRLKKHTSTNVGAQNIVLDTKCIKMKVKKLIWLCHHWVETVFFKLLYP